MAAKNEKPKAQSWGFKENSGQSAPAELFQQTPPAAQVLTPIAEPGNTVADQQPTVTKPAGKVGRPKGEVTKVKKTFYLVDGVENLKSAQVELVKQAGLFIKDESEVAELALALLAKAVKDPARVQEVTEVYNQEIKK